MRKIKNKKDQRNTNKLPSINTSDVNDEDIKAFYGSESTLSNKYCVYYHIPLIITITNESNGIIKVLIENNIIITLSNY